MALSPTGGASASSSSGPRQAPRAAPDAPSMSAAAAPVASLHAQSSACAEADAPEQAAERGQQPRGARVPSSPRLRLLRRRRAAGAARARSSASASTPSSTSAAATARRIAQMRGAQAAQLGALVPPSDHEEMAEASAAVGASSPSSAAAAIESPALRAGAGAASRSGRSASASTNAYAPVPSAARARSYAKLSLLACTLAARYVVTPALAVPFSHWAGAAAPAHLQPGAGGGADLRALKHGGGGSPSAPPDGDELPDSPFKLAFDVLSIAGLVLAGGAMAGLTLGLMGLDMVNLQVLSTSGTPDEQRHARKVLKLLEKGRHWVLVVLLLGNVIVNETLPIFLSDFGGGLAAVLTSTLLIVIFGEIVPQSICARHGLAIGAFCAPLVHAIMIILAPVAWPTAKLLDWVLGEEHGTTYRKAELKTFVSLHQQVGADSLSEDEVTIIRAVLDLNDKTVKDVMTPIEDVYTLSSESILNEEGIAKLVKNGYSRIPVHEPKRQDAILGMLLVKSLISYDPEDSMPVSSFQLHPLPEASPDLTLFDCLNYFQQGRSHMILVSAHPGEPRGALGVVTLEDVIEEMIGREIVDESDIFEDVHNKIRVVRNRPSSTQEQWQPLIRGIIERRRKFGGGGAMNTPLRSSFGLAPKDAGKYGSLGNSNKTGHVTIKRPETPSGSRRNSEAYNSRELTRKNTADSAAGFESESSEMGSPRLMANGAYVVEFHEDRPRIWGHADLSNVTQRPVDAPEPIREQPNAEARAEANGAGDGEDENSERRPLLGRIGNLLSRTKSDSNEQ